MCGFLERLSIYVCMCASNIFNERLFWAEIYQLVRESICVLY